MKIIVNESLPMFRPCHFSFNGFCLWADTLLRMHIGMENYKFCHKQSQAQDKVLFIYKQQQRFPSAIALVSSGFKVLQRRASFI